MSHADTVWRDIAARHNLVEPDVTKFASWWHIDSDLGRDLECLIDMTKSRRAGFLGFRSTLDSFTTRVNHYWAADIIP